VQRFLPTAGSQGDGSGNVALDRRWSYRDWGDEWVVLDGATGDCHLLSAACGAVLGALMRSPRAGSSPVQLFAAAFGDDMAPTEAEMSALADALAQLESLGLARACVE
jgi:hypothetical protein